MASNFFSTKIFRHSEIILATDSVSGHLGVSGAEVSESVLVLLSLPQAQATRYRHVTQLNFLSLCSKCLDFGLPREVTVPLKAALYYPPASINASQKTALQIRLFCDSDGYVPSCDVFLTIEPRLG